MSHSHPLAVVVLAAGQGTRMKSSLPKVLHPIAGRSMLGHVLDSCAQLEAKRTIVVTAPDLPQVLTSLDANVQPVFQHERLGTGHATQQALPLLEDFTGAVLILFGDTPLITSAALKHLLASLELHSVGIAAFRPADAKQYGRVISAADGKVSAIVEYKDASDDQRKISLCNGGIMAVRASFLRESLPQLQNNNAQGEYYLTDLASIAAQQGLSVGYTLFDQDELMGVNSRLELAQAEAVMQRRLREQALLGGVTMLDPSSVYLSYDTRFGQDVLIEPHCFFGTGVTVHNHVTIKAFSHLEGCTIRQQASIGPFARIRPESDIGEKARVGNFVELKKTQLGQGSKVNHLSYVGDAIVEQDVNIGAGTITCNYDGFFKYQTHIEQGAFIGSNSALVAPVRIGKDALVAAGTTVTKDVPSEAIAYARAKQHNALGAESKRRADKQSQKAAAKAKS